MKKWPCFLVSAIAFLVSLWLPVSAAAQSSCSASDVTALDGGVYNFQMNEYDSSLEECATINGIGYTITTAEFANATNGEPATYTSVYRSYGPENDLLRSIGKFNVQG